MLWLNHSQPYQTRRALAKAVNVHHDTVSRILNAWGEHREDIGGADQGPFTATGHGIAAQDGLSAGGREHRSMAYPPEPDEGQPGLVLLPDDRHGYRYTDSDGLIILKRPDPPETPAQ